MCETNALVNLREATGNYFSPIRGFTVPHRLPFPSSEESQVPIILLGEQRESPCILHVGCALNPILHHLLYLVHYQNAC